MKPFLPFLFMCITELVIAQPVKLDMDAFARRRERFSEALEPGSVAIFPCKPEYLRNLDVDHDYRQESNFYYLSGFEEPESILLINPSAKRHKYVMYVRKRDPRRETYDGPRAGVKGAMDFFRADTALLYADFAATFQRFIGHDRTLYYTFGINPEIDEIMRRNVIERRASGKWPIIDPAPIVDEMRLIKDEGDWKMGMKRAINISVEAHIEAMKAIKPGIYEYEIQAVFEYVFRRNGSPRNGYPCIVGSGPNSGILHYNKNNRMMNDGEVILMDCAAEYGYYSSDITRTVPVNGTFTAEQRDIYQLVLDSQNAGMRLVRPGLKKSEIDKAIDSVLGNGLVKLGFIKDSKDFRMFTLHGYAHWIGLEVHDVGGYTRGGESIILEPGMLFTIEPGIYVRPDVFDKMTNAGYTEKEIGRIRPVVERYMNIGVRIEDNIVVTADGYENLSDEVPREIDAIEALMKQRGIGQM